MHCETPDTATNNTELGCSLNEPILVCGNVTSIKYNDFYANTRSLINKCRTPISR
jgi:hypothetical protein